MTTPRTPELEDVLRLALDSLQARIHVALPGRVESYDAVNQTANVKPLIKNTFVDDEGTNVVEELPVINQVPVQFARGGGYFLSFPLAKGDHVLLVFNERSIDKFQDSSGEDVDPVDTRMHNLSDAVALPGFYPESNSIGGASPDDLVIGKDGGMQIAINDAGEVVVGDGAKSAIMHEDFAPQHNTHTHPTAFGPSGVPTTPLSGAEKSATLKLNST